jgi:hypothetical protein
MAYDRTENGNVLWGLSVDKADFAARQLFADRDKDFVQQRVEHMQVVQLE